ncbi:MAG: glucose-1-phosphate thymidylyltransferase [Pirellulaceae bacterium]|jgi:UDP-N-acetylglucosamine diphosphorylase / glucose-1-phosphate thymidylyltransferase / UDP-N-acetylgalactosamine diphosphorylase / glucosamine-1-phosphate N-acetyltransferase / galactosamine-1-phosphate N-acetyltransferase|nr:glucose-1-phosphate thymidylyltransferase [Pirellulaceae bacterium]
MNILLFEDTQIDHLYPLTTSRPGFALNVGGFRLYDLLSDWDAQITGFVRPFLRELVKLDYSFAKPRLARNEWTLLVNARLVPSLENCSQLRQLANTREAVVVRHGDRVLAGFVPTAALERLSLDCGLEEFQKTLELCLATVSQVSLPLPTLEFPHDLVRHHMANINANLQERIRQGSYREISEGVFAAEGARISDFVVTNSRNGPIIIESNTVIGPFCFLRGPVYVGANSRVNEHASLKDGVYIGHTAKIGGEVEGSVIECFSNKQHHGFLGHSYLGSWINLGAGTCNSDLKNTYGEVKMDYLNQKIATGMQFVGCFIGDYAKTAINTSIFTGKTIGVCSMVYGFVTTNVPSFVNYARSFGQITESPPAVMEATQLRMFSRRDVQQRPVDIQLLADMYNLTRRERQMSEEPLSL